MPYQFETDYTIEQRRATLAWRTTLRNKIDGNVFQQAELDAMKNLAVDLMHMIIDEPQVTADARENALSLNAPAPAVRVENNVTIVGSPSGDASPSWSSDSRRIAYVSNLDTATKDLFIMDVTGSGRANIYSGVDAVAWSPVEDKLAIVLNSDNKLYTITSAGQELSLLLDMPDIRDLRYSPDGNNIAFSSLGIIYILSLMDYSVTQVTNGSSPAWSADGFRLVFSNSQQIYTITLSSGVVSSSLASGTSPTWSHAENKIIFVQGTDIYTMKDDGTAKTVLSASAEAKTDLVISPNNRTVTYVQAGRVHTVGVIGLAKYPEYRHEYYMREATEYHYAWAYDHALSFREQAETSDKTKATVIKGRTSYPYREDDINIVDRSLARHGYRELREGEAPPDEVVGKNAPTPGT